MAADPRRCPAAVEELIRWVTPLNNMFRTAAVDAEVGGQAIAAGDRLALLYPSANRDEDVFADPFTFDTARNPTRTSGSGSAPTSASGRRWPGSSSCCSSPS